MVLVRRGASRELVAACCDLATAAGVRPDMTLAHARALLGKYRLVVRDHQPAQDLAALVKLAVWATRFSPTVAPDPPDGLILDITGCKRLFGSEETLAARLAENLARLGFGARLAIAPTLGCAWAVSRYGQSPLIVVSDGQARSALAELPVAALRLEAPVVTALAEVGIERVDQLWNLPRKALAQRFGPAVLRRLDQALNPATAEPVKPVRPRDPPQAVRDFDGPVRDLEPLLLVARQLLESLAKQLLRHEAGVTRLSLRVERYQAQPIVLEISLSRPSRDVRHLWAMLKERVERLPLDAGIERLTLIAARVGRLAHQQLSVDDNGAVFDAAHLAQAWGEFVDVLTNRLGPQRVTRLIPTASHWPRTAYRHQMLTEKPTARSRSRLVTSTLGDVVTAPRPTLLLEQPEQAQVIAATPEGPPSWLRWRGQEHRVVSAAGPERIAAPWWPPQVSKRKACVRVEHDYFRIEDNMGRWLWVYRERHTGRWYVEGLWA